MIPGEIIARPGDITLNGDRPAVQLTVPAAVRKQLGLKTGDIVDFYIEEGESAVGIVARNKSIVELAGMLDAYRPGKGRAVSIEEMDEAVGQHLGEKHDRISREWS